VTNAGIFFISVIVGMIIGAVFIEVANNKVVNSIKGFLNKCKK